MILTSLGKFLILSVFVRKTALLWFIFALQAAAFGAEQPLREITAIRNLPSEIAAKGQPVEFEAQILRKHRSNGLFVFDGEFGIYVIAKDYKTKLPFLEVGDLIKISGVSDAGGFLPSVLSESIEKIESRPLPTPREFHSSELYSTSIDCDWVKVTGRLISMEKLEIFKNVIALELEHGNLRYHIQMFYSPETERKVASKMLEMVSFNAVVGTLYNRQRQMGGRVFFVNSADDLHILTKSPFPIDEKPTPIHELMRLGFDQNHPVKTYGVVTSIGHNQLTLRGEKSKIQVNAYTNTEVSVGDHVTVEGFVWPQAVSPVFRARSIHVDLNNQAAPPATTLKLERQINPDYNFDLVQIDATVIDWQSTFTRGNEQLSQEHRILHCRSGSHIFEARLPVGIPSPPNIKPGATVRLTGICNLTLPAKGQWHVLIDRFWIQLREADDIAILQTAPWWTKFRLLALLAIVLAIAAPCLAWAFFLRKTVTRQTSEISRQIQQAAVMDERQRIARELHDNFDQGLAGAVLQISAGKRILEKKLAKTLEHAERSLREIPTDQTARAHIAKSKFDEVRSGLDSCNQTLQLAKTMLKHCSQESRNAIHDLRCGILERMDLEHALQEMLNTLGQECNASMCISTEGTPYRLKLEAERNLFLVAREAATNAARHGTPCSIHITLAYRPEQFSLTIRDDGAGFNINESASANHFGIQGMYERANRLLGELSIESELGSGTCVTLSLPNLEQWNAS